MAPGPGKPKPEKKVTRYTHDEIKEPRTPETGHTSLLPADEQVVTLPMDNGWSKAIEVGKLPEGDERPVVVDMDPAGDPVLFWAGKRNRREVPVLPLQRNEIVSESRIAQIIERARRAAEEKSGAARQGHLFADLEKTLREGDRAKRVEFYTHEEGWKNKLICGDSLHVMESLLHYENLRGKVQMIYCDPPYGIDYNSNFQKVVGAGRNEDDATDTADDVLTIKAFRDTWSLGVHSYLSYLRERLYLCRDLLSDSGSVFLQISDANLHLCRALMDEVFGYSNFSAQILFRKSGGLTGSTLNRIGDYLIWYFKDAEAGRTRYRQLYRRKIAGGEGATQYRFVLLEDDTLKELSEEELATWPEVELVAHDNITSQGNPVYEFPFRGRVFKGPFKPPKERLQVLADMGRLCVVGRTLRYVRRMSDFPWFEINHLWQDTGVSGFGRSKVYAVQTSDIVVERCVNMTTHPGELVLDPTIGSGTTALAAERLGRRWIGIDSSRVAVNTARWELLRCVFPHFCLRGSALSGEFEYETVPRVRMSGLIDGKEPETVALLDRPLLDRDAIRVCGPFEVASLGRYSVEDWKGYVVRESGIGEAAKLENYIEVICRLYRKDAAIQGARGLVHAVAETEKDKIAMSVGPLSGRVTCKQINDAVQDALASGILEVHVLGWAFEANVGEVKSQLEKRGKVKVELIMIRPDTLAEGLKATQPENLFSPLALPDIEVTVEKNAKAERTVHVALKGVALFDRKRRTTEYKAAASGYVSAWYLDEDYDGDCFVDCQMFFDFKKTPNIKAALEAEVDAEEFTLKLASEAFPVRGYKRIAVKVVDVYGNESTVVRDLA
ncbi:MAG TPA: site-specific DNA-methyltransferase [Planctomycetota bacterium]|jgi:adenine-specific DNA-methyltransferase|nr:site-specific DNA-methyltransferase [Planctomycetota bacterium]